MRSNALNAYAQNAARIESPEKLVQMLFEGVLRFTAQAKKSIEDGDIEKKVYWLNRSIDIFAELINSLNYEKGGEIANYLNGLYSHQIYLLSTANLENSTEPIDTVITVTRGLIDAWKDVTGMQAQ